MNNVTPIKPESTLEDNHINLYLHCELCMDEMPDGQSPQKWAQLECGWTTAGLQVWCKRHDCNVLNIDFEGHKHPASIARKPLPGEKA